MEVRSQAGIETLEVRIAYQSVLIHIIHGQCGIPVFKSFRERKIVVLHQGGAVYLFGPIRIGGPDASPVLVEIVLLDLRAVSITIDYAVRMCSIGILIGLPIDFAKLLRIQHIETGGKGLGGQRHVEVYFDVSFFRSLGRNNDDAVGGLSSIDSGRGCIFQYLDRLDIIGGKDRSNIIACLYSIDDVERRTVINGRRAAY